MPFAAETVISHPEASRRVCRMKHRHLDIKSDHWGVAVIESIWERGSDEDIRSLLRECMNDPIGPAANAIRRAIPYSKVYGYPSMFRLFLEYLEQKQ